MKKIALVHVGLHKTGSTSIQAALKKNEKNALAYIPETFRINDNTLINHAELAWYIYGDARQNLNNKIEEFKAEIKNKKIILLSSEDFSLVLSNQETKSMFEKILHEYEIFYIIFFRNMGDRDIVLPNEFKKHYKAQKRSRYIGTLIDFFKLKFNGKIKYNLYSSKYKIFFFTSHKKLIRTFQKKTRGKFLFFEYNKTTDIFKPLRETGLFKNFYSENIFFNKSKMWTVLKILNYIFKSKKIFIKKNRIINNINILSTLFKKNH